MVQKKARETAEQLGRNETMLSARLPVSHSMSPPSLSLSLSVSIAADEPFQIDSFFRRFARPSVPCLLPLVVPHCPSSVCPPLASLHFLHGVWSTTSQSPRRIHTGEQSYKTVMIIFFSTASNFHSPVRYQFSCLPLQFLIYTREIHV